jgi:hypothetical protein
MPHLKSEGSEKRLQEFRFDFCFMGDEGGTSGVGEAWPILVVCEVHSEMVSVAGAPSKSTGSFIAHRCMAFLQEFGCESCDVIATSDNELAITLIIAEVGPSAVR